MVWGFLRVMVFGVAFLIGGLIAGGWGPTVSARSGNTDAAELSKTGTSLLVTCADGNPTVQHVSGPAVVEVKCSNSKMQVIHTEPEIAPDKKQNTPSIPVAAFVRMGPTER